MFVLGFTCVSGTVGFDWTVDGVPLAAWMKPWTSEAPTPGSAGWKACSPMRGPVLRSGRSPIYECAVCLQPDCGIFSVRVTHHATTTIWHDFAWETHKFDIDVDPDFSEVPALVFEQVAYEETLGRILDEFSTTVR